MTSVIELSRALLLALNGPIHPERGIHRDVPEDDYHRWHAVSKSWLDALLNSPAHLRYYLEHPTEPTEAKRIGSAVHRALLEPERFDEMYVRGPPGNWTLKANRDAVAELRAGFPTRLVLHEEEYDAILGARDAVYNHPVASKLFDNPEWGYEVSACWEHPDIYEGQGILCKARADILRPDIGCIVDLKKVRSASRSSFQRSLALYRYAAQASWYLRGFNSVFGTHTFESFAFIAVEEEPPHGVAVYEVTPEDIRATDRQNLRLLRQYAECAFRDEWPGYPEHITYAELPEWARYALAEDL